MSLENNQATDEISLKELILKSQEWFRFLVSKWKIILICGFFGGLVGLTIAWLDKPIYTATTSFVLEDAAGGSGGLGSLSGLASIAGLDLGGKSGGLFQGDNLLEFYKSRLMIVKTLLTEVNFEGKKQLLIERYIEKNELREQWEDKPKLKNIQFRDTVFSRTQDSVLSEIVKMITKEDLEVIKKDKKLSIITAKMRSKDEFFAKTFNEKIVANVNDFYVKTRTKKSIDNVKILQEKTDSVRAVMNGAIVKVASVVDRTPNLNTTRMSQRTAPSQRSQFTIETNKAMLSQLIQNLELAKVSLLKESPLIQIIDEPVYPLEKKKSSRLIGLILGGFLGGFLACLVILMRKVFSNVLGAA
ncbi:MAG: lipopolysaccharide biosynthesis protein [Sphingobacteriaceae bacterium]|nr:lipopolysaccharide biosynthesis protein [Sphingobacteriaceae bacterium]